MSPIEHSSDWGAAIGRADAPERFQLRRGAMSSSWPMALQSGPALALEAQPLLERAPCDQAKGAHFLLGLAQNDPDRLFTRPVALPRPQRPFEPFEWLWDGAAWSARAQSPAGELFQAPLFAFWLVEAALSKQERPGAASEVPTRLSAASKPPVPAWASLGWAWHLSHEPRAWMCVLASRAHGSPEAFETLASLVGDALASRARAIAPAAWDELLASAQPGQLAILRACQERLAMAEASPAGPVRSRSRL